MIGEITRCRKRIEALAATITLWNKLLNETVNATSIDTFAELIAQ